MSNRTHEQQVLDIMSAARPVTDPDKLREYRDELNEIGEWLLAQQLERDAKAMERKYAEQAAR
jgi:hypothetical protein